MSTIPADAFASTLGERKDGQQGKEEGRRQPTPQTGGVFENKMKQKKVWVSSTGIELELPKLRECWRNAAQGKQAHGMQFARCILSTDWLCCEQLGGPHLSSAIWEPRAAGVCRRQLISGQESLLDPQFSPVKPPPQGTGGGHFHGFDEYYWGSEIRG